MLHSINNFYWIFFHIFISGKFLDIHTDRQTYINKTVFLILKIPNSKTNFRVFFIVKDLKDKNENYNC